MAAVFRGCLKCAVTKEKVNNFSLDEWTCNECCLRKAGTSNKVPSPVAPLARPVESISGYGLSASAVAPKVNGYIPSVSTMTRTSSNVKSPSGQMQTIAVEAFFDKPTSTLTYVVYDPDTRDAVIIDPVLDFDPQLFQTSNGTVKDLVTFVALRGLKVHYVMETHVHADHLTSAHLLRKRLGCKSVVGSAIQLVQRTFANLLDLPDQKCDGSQFDVLVNDGDTLRAGSLFITGISTPGHTPACTTYRIGDMIFTGDTLFMPDFGTGRCDFPNGSADKLYTSVHDKLYQLPDNTKVFVGHDYQPGGRELKYETSIGDSKTSNIHLKASTTRDQFVKFREGRDATLAHPKLLFQSLQVNINNGQLPSKHANGLRYMVMPLNTVKDTDDCGDVA